MQFIAFILLYPVFWLISILPFRLLYFFSDLVYVLMYRIIGYRKKTVRENLAIALPHYSAAERKAVEKKFYRHFCDTFFEMVKTMTISMKEMEKRFVFENIELVHAYEEKNKSVVLYCSHYASYEWLLYMNTKFRSFKGYGIYKRLRNKYFDKLVRDIRAKFNAELISTKDTIPVMRDDQRKGIRGFYGFLSDQSPKVTKATYWTKFFGVEVPVHIGAELLAKKLDMNVMLVFTEKVKRGYYKTTFVPYDRNPKEVPNFEITDFFLELLEKHILKAPEYYLWTHKRFKHRKDTAAETTEGQTIS